MMSNKEHWEYDVQRRARAGTGATLRALVAGYLIYLAWQIVKGVRSGETNMPPALAYGAAIFFTLAAIAFVVYLIRRWRAEVEAARLPAAEPAENAEDEAERTGEQP